jgi:hypothetical protein
MRCFDPDRVVVDLLPELGALGINDDCARAERGFRIAYPVKEMVEDFIEEYETHRNHYK